MGRLTRTTSHDKAAPSARPAYLALAQVRLGDAVCQAPRSDVKQVVRDMRRTRRHNTKTHAREDEHVVLRPAQAHETPMRGARRCEAEARKKARAAGLPPGRSCARL